jgi:hypothetical protein
VLLLSHKAVENLLSNIWKAINNSSGGRVEDMELTARGASNGNLDHFERESLRKSKRFEVQVWFNGVRLYWDFAGLIYICGAHDLL